MKKLLVSLIIIITTSLIGIYFYSLVTVKKLHHLFPIWDQKNNSYVLTGKKPKHWIDVDQVNEKALWAIIISEDWAFYQHKGLDFNQLRIVLEDSLRARKLVRGASTITQQVVKNTLLTNERSIIRKLKEMVLAIMLENEFSKRKVLEFYINLIELGEDLYGIKNASYFYFQKHPSNLNAKEGSFLAMLLPSPKRYSQSFRQNKLTPFAKEQVNKILAKLKIAKIITEEELEILKDTALSFETDIISQELEKQEILTD